MAASTDIADYEKYNNIDQYKSDIQSAVNEYLDNLINDDDIYKTEVFNGLVNWIYYKVFKPDKRTKRFHVNAKFSLQNSIINYTDTDTIADLWELYKQLCSRYKKSYTLQQFCSMTGISTMTLNNWIKGVKGSTQDRRELLDKVKQDVESGLWSKTLNDNGIGSMFGLKALYGYSDNQTVIVRNESLENIDSVDDIAERHKLDAKPETPMIEE